MTAFVILLWKMTLPWHWHFIRPAQPLQPGFSFVVVRKDLCLHCPSHLLAYCFSPLHSSSPWCCPSTVTHSHTTPFPVAVHLFWFTFPVCVRVRVSCFPSVSGQRQAFFQAFVVFDLFIFLFFELQIFFCFGSSLMLLILLFDRAENSVINIHIHNTQH